MLPSANLTTGVKLCSETRIVGRAARDDHDWWRALLERVEQLLGKAGSRRPASIVTGVGESLRLAGMLVAAYIGLGAVGLTISIVLGYADITAAAQALQLGGWGAVMMFVLQLALLPLFVVWSGAWLTGAGFSIGLGSSASPFGALLGPVPGIPVLAAVPDGWGAAAVLAPVILLLAGVVGGALLGDAARKRSVAGLFGIVMLAAVLAGLSVGLLSWSAGGSLGPGRLAVIGPEVWITALLAAAELGFGSLLGALAARADLARRAVAAVPLPRRDAAGFETGSTSATLSAVPADPSILTDADALTGTAVLTDTDEQLTVPIEPLAPVVHLRPLDEFATRASEFEAPQEEEPSPEQETVPLGDREPPAREPVLFDQQEETGRGDEQQTVEIEPLDSRRVPGRSSAGVSPVRRAIDPQTTDPDALVEAYSWDGVYDEQADETGSRRGDAEPKDGRRPGWRRPRRKG